jgi:hypothetical protein
LVATDAERSLTLDPAKQQVFLDGVLDLDESWRPDDDAVGAEPEVRADVEQVRNCSQVAAPDRRGFGARLNEALRARGVRKLYPLAIELGVDESALSRWRKGGAISLDSAIRLAEHLDVSLDWPDRPRRDGRAQGRAAADGGGPAAAGDAADGARAADGGCGESFFAFVESI